jgi:hypothetical protein
MFALYLTEGQSLAGIVKHQYLLRAVRSPWTVSSLVQRAILENARLLLLSWKIGSNPRLLLSRLLSPSGFSSREQRFNLICSPGVKYSATKNPLYRRVEWQRPIFPRGCPLSIIGAERLNCRVRDGNGCFPSAIVTTPPACTSEWSFPGGDEGTRTPDICLAKAALFQLSYIPAQTGWAFLDSNQGPQSYQDCALTT